MTICAAVMLLPGAGTWLPSNSGLPATGVADVEIAKSASSTAYAATESGVFRTDDGGAHWTMVNPARAVSRVAVNPVTANIAYVSARSGSVQRTTDGGATWKEVRPDFARLLAIAPSDTKTIYGAFVSGLSKSTDAGDTWQPIGGIFLGYYGFFPTSIDVDRSNAANVALATQDLVAQTTNGGASWSTKSWDETGVAGITIDPSDFSMLYGGRHTTGFIKSSDGGATWNVTGLSNKHVTTLLLRGSSLYAGTEDGRIYRSDDRGSSWIGFDQGTSLGSVVRLTADSAGAHFLAGTTTSVYRYDAPQAEIGDPVPVDEDPLRFAQTIDAIAEPSAANAGLIVPIAGTAHGVGGTNFTTELLLSNANPRAQKIRITWLPQGFISAASLEMTVPGLSDPGGGTADLIDAGAFLSRAGLGSLLIAAVDDSGNVDSTASIGASTIVWSEFGDRRAPASQLIPIARSNELQPHNVASLSGLRQDAQLRTNVGIVNLSAQPHEFTVQATGERSTARFTIDVAPWALVHAALPGGDYGVLSLNVSADSSGARWLLYGSSIDRTTGEAETSLSSSYQ